MGNSHDEGVISSNSSSGFLCYCMRLTLEDIQQALERGRFLSVDALMTATQAGQHCTSCRINVRRIFQSMQGKDPDLRAVMSEIGVSVARARQWLRAGVRQALRPTKTRAGYVFHSAQRIDSGYGTSVAVANLAHPEFPKRTAPVRVRVTGYDPEGNMSMDRTESCAADEFLTIPVLSERGSGMKGGTAESGLISVEIRPTSPAPVGWAVGTLRCYTMWAKNGQQAFCHERAQRVNKGRYILPQVRSDADTRILLTVSNPNGKEVPFLLGASGDQPSPPEYTLGQHASTVFDVSTLGDGREGTSLFFQSPEPVVAYFFIEQRDSNNFSVQHLT